MTKINDGGPAFPGATGEHPGTTHPGMSQRVYLASQALVAIGTWCPSGHAVTADEQRRARAAYAVAQADALIAELAKEPSDDRA